MSNLVVAVLHAHGLWGFLDAVVCGDVQQGKPDPLGIEHCLERFRTNARCALLVALISLRQLLDPSAARAPRARCRRGAPRFP